MDSGEVSMQGCAVTPRANQDPLQRKLARVTGWFARRNWTDRFDLLKSLFIWMFVTVVYHDQLKVAVFPFFRTLPSIRGRGGVARVGRNARMMGSLEIIFEDCSCRGLLEIGDKFRCENDVTLAPRGGTIQIGHDCFVGKGSLIQATSGSSVLIGDDVLVANMVTIVASNHSTRNKITPMGRQPESGAGICIGSDVWIGAHAVLTDGSTIGDGAVVAAGAVVTRDVAAFSIVAGVPAVQIRLRGEEP